MRSEKEIKEHYEMLLPLKPILHPSLFTSLEWILEIGIKEDQEWLFNFLKQASDDQKKKEIKN